MHQPFYKNLVTGEYKLPWTRLHALKDYYGMVRILDDYPKIHQTFNLVPSMLVQIEEYAAGAAEDRFLQCALKPAEDLSADEQAFVLQYFFQANPPRLIYRYPRYGELYDAWLGAERDVARARRYFGTQALRDLQVWSQLAWFDEDCQRHDRAIAGLIQKGGNFSLDDQTLVAEKERELLRKVLPVYATAAARGQIEISATPYYHPILPLLCDSSIAAVSHPNVPLPTRFAYPEDARRQLTTAREYVESRFQRPPDGLWPSEGSVSDEALEIAAEIGFRWAASDNGVLARTLHTAAIPAVTYRPYLWRRGARDMRLLFRDHHLSDLIGFVYARMDMHDAADHFLGQIRDNCRGILAEGRDALVPVILDGENAWEYYEHNGRPFLRELYRRITEDPGIEALTVSEALARVEPQRIDHIFPGSWIGANFDVWIGSEEDNLAWEYLLKARQAYQRAVREGTLTEEARKLAYEELLIAEGSDWCWWYGPEHASENRPEFDQLYRDHLVNVYKALGLPAPDELSRPILHVEAAGLHHLPAAVIRATVDGEVTSYFEWLGAGSYRVDQRSGAMHGQRFLVRDLQYGCDGERLFLRLDFEQNSLSELADAELHLQFKGPGDGAKESYAALGLQNGITSVKELRLAGSATAGDGLVAAFQKILEIGVSLNALGVAPSQPVWLQISLWRGGLPLDALPPQGWLEISTRDPAGY